MKVRVGIDVGSDGGYAIFVDNRLHSYGKIPSTETELDMSALLQKILDANDSPGDSYHVVIEDLHSVFNSSASSNFTFGVNNGLVIGMLQVSCMPFTKVAPKKWQKELWEGIRPIEIIAKGKFNKDGSQKYKVDTKATSLVAAKRLFPKEKFLATERSKVPHNGIVDAVLLAEYCTRKF